MSSDQPIIRVAREPERRQALELVLRPLAAEARAPLIDAVAAAEPQSLGPLDALFVAVRRDAVVAAAWAQPAPGRSAALWTPEWVGARPPGATTTERRLVAATSQACDVAGVAMTQALFDSADDPRTLVLIPEGFFQIAELIYLGRSIPSKPEPIDCESLRFDPFGPGDHNRLKRLVSRTYEESLDCPGLENLRDLEDVLIGYRTIGRYDPAHWLFVQQGDEEVGVLLMAEHPDADQAELVYMGVTPEARGRGLGKLIVSQAVLIASRMGVDHLMAAVDRRNKPARTLYDEMGFAPWAERSVYVRARDGKQPRKA